MYISLSRSMFCSSNTTSTELARESTSHYCVVEMSSKHAANGRRGRRNEAEDNMLLKVNVTYCSPGFGRVVAQ